MKKSLKSKIKIAVLAIVFFIDISCIVFNYTHYVSVNREYIDSIAETVANTCELIIDGDRVAEYLATGQRDTKYYELWNRLIDYRNTNEDIVNLSVVKFEQDGMYYVIDTDLSESGAFLGDVERLDSLQEKKKVKLINMEDVDAIEYKNHRDIYVSIKSSYNIPVAYVIVGMSSVSAKKAQILYLIELTAIVTVITICCGMVLIWYMNRNVIRPINMMAYAAANYFRHSDEEHGEKKSSLSEVRVQTGDELERLCEAMKKMESDILESSMELAEATWDSHHDSMTKLYNKRYFQEMQTVLQNEKDLGIIYFDIDNLKRMNDTYGHDRGDEMIQRAAEFIRKYMEAGSFGSRTGGDEFVMVLRNCTEERLAEIIARMRADQERILAEDVTEFCCQLAVGGTIRRADEPLEETLRRADECMYEDKHVRR